MKLVDLKIFKDNAYKENFSKVAKIIFLTHPSVSFHLKHLEDKLGVKLFSRVPRKVTLTKEGEILLPYVETALLQCDKLKTVESQSKHKPTGTLRLATIYSIGRHELHSEIKGFIKAYLDIHIQLQYRRPEIIYDLVLKKKDRLGISGLSEASSWDRWYSFGKRSVSFDCATEPSLVWENRCQDGKTSKRELGHF